VEHHIASLGCCGAHLDPNTCQRECQNITEYIDARKNVKMDARLNARKKVRIYASFSDRMSEYMPERMSEYIYIYKCHISISATYTSRWDVRNYVRLVFFRVGLARRK
jgi:hypothetical protein